MFEAARLTDPLAHTSALAGFLTGALIGIALIAAVAFATFTCGFGVALLAGLVAGVGASVILNLCEGAGRGHSSPSGAISSGSSNVFINGKAAAYATASTSKCSKHNPTPLVAQGSSNVFINGMPAARKGDAITCGAKIDAGSPNVFIGGGTETYLPVADEVPNWLRTSVDWAFALAGLVGGLAGLFKAAGGLSRAVLPCAAKFIGGFIIGEAVGRYVAAPIVSRAIGGLVGHPVDVTTGRKLLLAQDEIDFVVVSPIPLVCNRFYASNLEREGTLGKGWVLPWELSLQARDGRIWYTDGQGRETGFPIVPPGQTAFSEAEQCYLACTADGRHILYDLNESYYDFGQVDAGGALAWVRRVEDRTGQWQHFERDEAGRVHTIHTSGGQQLGLRYAGAPSRLAGIDCVAGGSPGPLVAYGYDDAGQLASVTDANGAVARRFSYTDGLMSSHSNALGFTCNYQWGDVDGQPRVLACATSEGERTLFSYDTAQRETWAEDELGRTARWRYDEHFQVVACTDFDGGEYRVAYTGAGQPELLHLPGGRTLAFEYDEAGRIVGETDPLGRVTRTGYDGNSLRVSRLTLPDGAQWLAEYDHLGRLLRTTDPLGRSESYDYPEGLSPWPHSHIDARGGRQGMLWDSRGLLTAYTDCSGKTTRHDYDADGQLLATTDALGHVTRFERQRTGEALRVVLPDGSAEEFRYDAAGLLIEQRDNFAQTRTWRRNARGQVLDAGGDAQRHLHYRYDAHGRLVELASDTGSRYGFAYDSADRLRLETRPDGVERHLRYDAAGELASLETVGVAAERNGERPRRLAQFERDAMGRLLAHTTATAQTRYDWDLGDRLIEAERAPSKAGAALGVEASAVRFDYDVAGRLLAEHGAEGAVAYTLDELDNLTTLNLPHGQRIDTLTYGSGHVHQIRSGERLISDFERDDLHREVQRTQGRLTQRVGYDLLGRRTWQAAGAAGEATGPGQGRLWRSYRYHPSGELAGQSDSLRGDIAFQYDPAGQLLRQTRAAEQSEERFAWDAAGNLLDDIGRKSCGQIEGNRLRVWQDLRFDYDAWGNLSAKRKGAHRSQRFTFDADDRLIKVSSDSAEGTVETRFDYDPLGRRIGASTTRLEVCGAPGGTARVERKRFVWQGLRMVQEVRESGVSSYVYSPDAAYTPLARLDAATALAGAAIESARQSARLYHFHTDLVGAPLEVTDEVGELAWAGKYKAWGKVEHGEDAALLGRIDQPLRYPGQYADESTGLHYNTFRYYDPDIGRFISQDPIGLAGGENLYTYAPNPTGWMDPLGLMPWVEPVNVGHHLIPQSLARSTGSGPVANFFGSNTKTPTFFFDQPYVSGSHEAIHAAQKPFIGKLSGKWTGTPAQLIRASGKGLSSVSNIRGDLKIPATGQIIAKNVTPRQAFSALLKWGRAQKYTSGTSGCR